jgi:hypothetical protein
VGDCMRECMIEVKGERMSASCVDYTQKCFKISSQSVEPHSVHLTVTNLFGEGFR